MKLNDLLDLKDRADRCFALLNPLGTAAVKTLGTAGDVYPQYQSLSREVAELNGTLIGLLSIEARKHEVEVTP